MEAGFLLFHDVEELDFVGPWEMMTIWRDYADGPACTMLAKNDKTIHCAKGMQVIPHRQTDATIRLDYLFVPGGIGTRALMHDEATLAFIRNQSEQGALVLSVCTGSLLLQAAGLLEGKQGTTHWSQLEKLEKLGVQTVERRYVQQDNVWTAAGVSAGIDMTLAFIAHIAGNEVAAKVQKYAEYYPDSVHYGTEQHHKIGA